MSTVAVITVRVERLGVEDDRGWEVAVPVQSYMALDGKLDEASQLMRECVLTSAMTNTPWRQVRV